MRPEWDVKECVSDSSTLLQRLCETHLESQPASLTCKLHHVLRGRPISTALAHPSRQRERSLTQSQASFSALCNVFISPATHALAHSTHTPISIGNIIH